MRLSKNEICVKDSQYREMVRAETLSHSDSNSEDIVLSTRGVMIAIQIVSTRICVSVVCCCFCVRIPYDNVVCIDC